MTDSPCPCCQAHADVARLTAERDADTANQHAQLHACGLYGEFIPNADLTEQLGSALRLARLETDLRTEEARDGGAELAQAHDLLASAVPGGPLPARIRALLSLWAASVVEKAKLQRALNESEKAAEKPQDARDADAGVIPHAASTRDGRGGET